MTLEELNEMVANGEMNEFIRVCEARQCKSISRIADAISERKGVRVVLLAGASSAGKTTTAKRLCTQLRVNGHTAMLCSTDDYFVGDARNPRLPDGTFDYETVEAVDAERLGEDVTGLLSGRDVCLRRFDFVRHEGYDAPNTTRLAPNGVLVIEGIHALNPLLSAGIPEEVRYHVFVEPVTQPEIVPGMPFMSCDARLLRRLVRDNSFRKLSPFDTFRLWPNVLAGERKWIDPFRNRADATFDSALGYELCVLKPYAGGLLEVVHRRERRNRDVSHLLEVLSLVQPIPSELVPGDSILRETIGSSQLEY